MSKMHRIQWLDFGKGLLILFVVLVHCLVKINFLPFNILTYFIFIFVMPAFFAISGYLYKPSYNLRGFAILCYKKISSFVIPYVSFSFLSISMHLIVHHKISVSNIINNLYHIYLSPIGYLWFLYSLFFIFIIIGFMDLIHLNLYVQVLLSCILIISSIYLPCQETGSHNINPVAGIGEYMICFYIGYLINKFRYNIKTYISKYNYYCLELIWVILIIAQMYITDLRGNIDLFNYEDIITKLLSIPVCFIVFYYCKHTRLFNYLKKCGKYTLLIYLVHLPIIVITTKCILHPFDINEPLLELFIYLILAWYGSIVMGFIAKKFSIIKFFFYPRKFINKLLNINRNNY